MVHSVIQGNNGEDNIGFTVLVDAVHGSDYSSKSVFSSSNKDRDLLSFPHHLQPQIWEQLRFKR